jgi:mono/diheme cytochrome c family protein
MYLKISLLFALTALITVRCSDTSSDAKIEKASALPTQQELADGFNLAENNCFTCHSPNASIENRVAPPMEAIKRHYINSSTTHEEFTSALISFLNNPSEEKSKMPGAVKRFNVMPKMNFSEAQIRSIATYIFYSELEKPDWFEKHYQQEKKKYGTVSETSSIDKGQEIAMQTKATLGKNLLEAINTKGTENAVSFCSTRAIPLTDSMSLALNAKIKRVSDKNRNPSNAANKAELAYIEAMKSALSQNKDLKPLITRIGDKDVGYYPILTNQMCLQCHGQSKTEILPKTALKIGTLYPQDKATGYKLNELRGIWVVEMDKK